MNTHKGLTQLKATFLGITALLMAVLLGVLVMQVPGSQSDGHATPPAAAGQPVVMPAQQGALPDTPDDPQPGAAAPPAALWIDNDGQFTAQTLRLQRWLDAGNPLEVSLGDGAPARYGLREFTVTTADFRLSSGIDSEMPAQYRVYAGRELLPDGSFGEPVSLAVVNGAVAMAITRDGEHFLVETDPLSGELYALALHAFDEPHVCGHSGCGGRHTACELSPDGSLAAVSAPAHMAGVEPERLPVRMAYPAGLPPVAMGADEPVFEAAAVSHSQYRLGQQYNKSLRDILVLWVSSKSQTGDSTQLSTRASAYFATAARTADAYERQLGLRYLLQELILVPSDSSDADPGNPPAGVYSIQPDLEHFRSWLTSNRPQATFKYGHAALWSLVDGGSGGVIGVAWTDSYGSATYGHSVQERSWGWEVHTHELGHNVGSSHTSGGIMNPSLISGNEDFFTIVSNTTYTAAKDIYNYMGGSRAFVFGDALLRHPEEIPFGIDDALSTAAGTAVTFNPLANDKTKVTNGLTNTLRLVEVGQVFPRAAGSARVVDGLIEFTPAAGFTGQAWFSYTLAGSVGNNGSGWLHAADVIVTVGGNSTAPSLTPAMSLVDDYVVSDFSQPIKINPLLNDEGSGRLWSGEVEVVIGPNDTTPESYSDRAFHLVSATVQTGNGSLLLDQRAMTRGARSSLDNTGLITYTPGASEGNEVVIRYTVVDANGATATAQIIVARTSAAGVQVSSPSVAEDSGEVVAFTFERTGNVNLSVEEVIDFTVSGTADPSGLRADYALAGHQAFDPISGAGTVAIPAGQRQAWLYAAILNDGVTEDYETCVLSIVGTSSGLEISQVYNEATLYIRDTSVIYVEPFDSFGSDSATWNGWTNLKNMNASGKGGEDWFDWAVYSGSTPTSGTGPTADHTSGTGKYMLAEASGNTTEFAYFLSPAIDVSGRSGAQLEFWYHMYGSGLGSLSLDLYVDGSLRAAGIWSRSGQQSTSGTDWRSALVDLGAYLPASSVQLRFRATIGSTELSDIAIDDVRVMAVAAAAPAAPQVLVDPVGCLVDEGQSVYLSVIPEAFPAPQIQWHKDGAAIPGATGPSYFIAAVDSTSVGYYSAQITNSLGSTVSLEASVDFTDPPPPPPPDGTPGDAFFAWMSFYSIIPPPPGDDSNFLTLDTDLDGVSNLFEFSFGSNPKIPDTHRLPVINVVEESGQFFLTITYYQRKKDPTGTTGIDYTADDVMYTVETATTLGGSWSSGVGVVEAVGTPVSIDADIERVTVRRVAPLTGGPAFLRLSVTTVGW